MQIGPALLQSEKGNAARPADVSTILVLRLLLEALYALVFLYPKRSDTLLFDFDVVPVKCGGNVAPPTLKIRLLGEVLNVEAMLTVACKQAASVSVDLNP